MKEEEEELLVIIFIFLIKISSKITNFMRLLLKASAKFLKSIVSYLSKCYSIFQVFRSFFQLKPLEVAFMTLSRRIHSEARVINFLSVFLSKKGLPSKSHEKARLTSGANVGPVGATKTYFSTNYKTWKLSESVSHVKFNQKFNDFLVTTPALRNFASLNAQSTPHAIICIFEKFHNKMSFFFFEIKQWKSFSFLISFLEKVERCKNSLKFVSFVLPLLFQSGWSKENNLIFSWKISWKGFLSIFTAPCFTRVFYFQKVLLPTFNYPLSVDKFSPFPCRAANLQGGIQ